MPRPKNKLKAQHKHSRDAAYKRKKKASYKGDPMKNFIDKQSKKMQ